MRAALFVGPEKGYVLPCTVLFCQDLTNILFISCDIHTVVQQLLKCHVVGSFFVSKDYVQDCL